VNLRVSGQTQTNYAIANLQRQGSLFAKYQDQVISGLKVKVASDDPANYPSLLRAKNEVLRFSTFAQTMSDATTDLNAGVDAMLEAQQTMVRARQIASEGANGPMEQAGLETLAVELDSLVNRLMTAGNSQIDGKYLFSGTASDTPPFRVAATDVSGRPATIAYDGSNDRARVLIGPGQTVDTKYAGSEVFQQPGGDLFQTLIRLRDNLRNPAFTQAERSQALNASLTDVQNSQDALSSATGEQSANLATLDVLKNRVGDLRLTSLIRATEIEGTDIAEAAVRLQEIQASLQASLAVTSRLLQPSLLDFIG